MNKLLSTVTTTVLFTALMAFSGYGQAKQASAKAKPVTLTVFAAASLTEALTEISELYKTAAPAVTLSYNFDSSGKLQTQIENGADADVFFSAGQKQMDAVAAQFIDPATRKDLLVNEIVLIVPNGSKLGLKSFEDCMTDKVKLMSLGGENVPVGQYSEEVFKFLNGWDKVKAKSSLGSNVKEVLAQVKTGSVDCGVVYATDAATEKSVTVVATAPKGSHKPAVYPAAVLKGTKNAAEAKAYLDYLSSPKAKAVFEKIGFVIVK